MAENNDAAGKPPLAPVPRRNLAQPPSSTPEPTAREQLADLVDSVKVLADQLGNEPAEAPDPSKDRAARRPKKFQRISQTEERRADAVPAVVAPAPAAAETATGDVPAEPEPADATSLNRNIAWPRLTRMSVPTAVTRQKRRKRSTTGPLLVLMACNVVMFVLGLLIGGSFTGGSNPPPPATAKASGPPGSSIAQNAPQGVSAAALDAADAALKAEKGNDMDAARRIYEDAVRQRLGLWGAEYRLALAAIKRGDLVDADLHLLHSTALGESLGPCFFIRATFAGAKGNFAEAGRQMEAAAHAEPFDGKYFFYWGECLRRSGKPLAAVSCFEQALNRPYTPGEGDLYLFKLGLAKVESGSDEAFNASLASHLGKPDVPGDWWLLAAAQDLERAAYPAAAGHLQKAEHALPPDVFDSRVRDYFFQAFAKQSELADYLRRTPVTRTTEAGAPVADPAAWTPDKADPAAWPSSAR